MAFVQADIDDLDAKYKLGIGESVTSDGKKVTFRTIDEYLRLRGLMLAEVRGSTRSPASFSVARITR